MAGEDIPITFGAEYDFNGYYDGGEDLQVHSNQYFQHWDYYFNNFLYCETSDPNGDSSHFLSRNTDF